MIKLFKKLILKRNVQYPKLTCDDEIKQKLRLNINKILRNEKKGEHSGGNARAMLASSL